MRKTYLLTRSLIQFHLHLRRYCNNLVHFHWKVNSSTMADRLNWPRTIVKSLDELVVAMDSVVDDDDDGDDDDDDFSMDAQ